MYDAVQQINDGTFALNEQTDFFLSVGALAETTQHVSMLPACNVYFQSARLHQLLHVCALNHTSTVYLQVHRQQHVHSY